MIETFPPICCTTKYYYVEVQQIGGKVKFSTLHIKSIQAKEGVSRSH